MVSDAAGELCERVAGAHLKSGNHEQQPRYDAERSAVSVDFTGRKISG
jgi:hypothetical protein